MIGSADAEMEVIAVVAEEMEIVEAVEEDAVEAVVKTVTVVDNVLILNNRMGARVVEGTGLENRQGCKLFVGSNPTPSANLLAYFFKTSSNQRLCTHNLSPDT